MSDAALGIDFTLGYYSSDRKTGKVCVVKRRNGEVSINCLGVEPDSGLEKALKPIFVGLTEEHRFILLDPETKSIRIQTNFPIDAFPAHIYSDPNANRDWFMNDGDKETGNDTVNCGDQGSSVTVIENTASASAKHLATICIGRGHHQANFAYPSEDAPNVPHTTYISNLKDGTVSAIGNNPNNEETYLKVIATIDLCEADKEKDGCTEAPCNAFPHGLVYSRVSGKLYNLNNGYGSIAVIDPLTNKIEEHIEFKGHSNLFATPCGRFIFGRGADRKSNPEHVIAKLTVMDAGTHVVLDSINLPDIYISKYYFNRDGSKLYLTTSSSGSPEQVENLKSDALLVFDLNGLPKIKLSKELALGTSSGSLAFHGEDEATQLVFSSNSATGTLVVIDGDSDELIESLKVTEGVSHSRVWLA